MNRYPFYILTLGILLAVWIALVSHPKNWENFPVSTPMPQPAHTQSVFCGGIANIQCPSGKRCVIVEKYPDAGGICEDISNNVPTTTESENQNETAAWDLYENQKYKFMFQYPALYHIKETTSFLEIIETPEGKSTVPGYTYEPYSFYAKLIIHGNNKDSLEDYFINSLCEGNKLANKSLEEWPKKLITGCITNFKNTKETLKSETILIAELNPYEQGHPVALFNYGGNLYEFHLVNTGETGSKVSEEHMHIFKKILSSFVQSFNPL